MATHGWRRDQLAELAARERAQPHRSGAVLAATVLAVDGGPLGAAGRRGECLVIAITDDDVYLLDCRAHMLARGMGRVVRHLPRSGVVVQWRRLLLDIRIELWFAEQHVFLTGAARACPQTDHVLGLLMASELAQH